VSSAATRTRTSGRRRESETTASERHSIVDEDASVDLLAPSLAPQLLTSA